MLNQQLVRRAEISIVLSDDAELHDLNRRYRGIDGPTDVLSFSQEGEGAEPSGHRGTRVLGDVIVSMDRAGAQARARSANLRDELCFLVAHGVLHLLGYDDCTENGLAEMIRLGDAAMVAAGLRPSA